MARSGLRRKSALRRIGSAYSNGKRTGLLRTPLILGPEADPRSASAAVCCWA
jgi:hypothetical protein